MKFKIIIPKGSSTGRTEWGEALPHLADIAPQRGVPVGFPKLPTSDEEEEWKKFEAAVKDFNERGPGRGQVHPFFLRDVLVTKALHEQHIQVHPLLVRISPVTAKDIERDVEAVETKGQAPILAYKASPCPVVYGGLRTLLACIYLGRV